MNASRQNPDHDRIGAGINRAIAYRLLFNYLQARERAEEQGADVAGLPKMEREGWAKINERYQELVENWLPELPDSITSARAFIDLAGVILIDRTLSDLFNVGTIVLPEKDSEIALRALTAIGNWLDRREAHEAALRPY
jgi:hypothetical protein